MAFAIGVGMGAKHMHKQPFFALKIWLLGVAGLVFALISIGGITRLTASGLSMVEWRLLMGILPPLSEGEWARVFALYQQSPEYQHINQGMSLDAFKWIFFWEFLHRIMGRLVGIAYIIPLCYFYWRGRIPSAYHPRFVFLLILGASQGLIGWWMVKSGLVDSPQVAPYRLAIHLGLALIILGMLIWTLADLHHGRAKFPPPNASASITLASIALTILAGALVAGLNGGRIYNEYPLMGGNFIPPEYGFYGWKDFFENAATAQFHHRWLGALSICAVLNLWHKSKTRGRAANILLALVIAQFLLGITTLLYQVPLILGVFHQAGAVFLLISVLWVAHERASMH